MELGDERQLLLDERAHVGRHAIRIARCAMPVSTSLRSELAGVSPGGTSSRDIRSAARRARTCSAPRHRSVAAMSSRRIEIGQPRARAQVPLAVGEQRMAAFGDRRAQADRGQRVLQRAPGAHVHVHVARGDQRQRRGAAERLQCSRGARRRRRREAAPRRSRRDRRRRRAIQRASRRLGGGDRGSHSARQRERAQATSSRVERGKRLSGRAAPAARDELGEIAVRARSVAIEHEPGAVEQRELAADDELQAGLLGCEVGAHHARQRAFVGDGECAVAERPAPARRAPPGCDAPRRNEKFVRQWSSA